MRLDGERIYLREYRPEDLARAHIYASIPEFSQYQVWGPNTKQDTQTFIAKAIAESKKSPRYEFELAICTKDEDLMIGGAGIRMESQTSKIASIGYAVNPDFQGKGIASDATKLLIEFGFKELALKVIYALCDTRNTASFRVMEKSGMQRVGKRDDHLVVRGHSRDSYRYEIYPD